MQLKYNKPVLKMSKKELDIVLDFVNCITEISVNCEESLESLFGFLPMIVGNRNEFDCEVFDIVLDD